VLLILNMDKDSITKENLIYLEENSAWLCGFGARHLGYPRTKIPEHFKGDQREFHELGWDEADSKLLNINALENVQEELYKLAKKVPICRDDLKRIYNICAVSLDPDIDLDNNNDIRNFECERG
jgi:hypothetical protein